MAENRFSKGVKAAKERTAELEANKNKQKQKSTFQKSFLTHQRKRNQLQKLFI